MYKPPKNIKNVLLFCTVIVVSLALGIYGAGYLRSAPTNGPAGESSPPANGQQNVPPSFPATPTTIRGEITCLPKEGSGPQTMECAIGLLGQDGQYYALENLPASALGFTQTGTSVEVSGTIRKEEKRGPDGNLYSTAGVLVITNIEKLN